MVDACIIEKVRARVLAGRGAMYRLGAELRTLREAAKLSGRALAAQVGWSQAKVSRIEKADVRTSIEDVRFLLEHLNVPARKRKELLELAREAGEAAARWRPPSRSGPGRLRGQLDNLVRMAQSVRHFQPTTVPGLLQTAEYARHALEMSDLEGMRDLENGVAAQLSMQRILFEPECPAYHFLLGEVGLRFCPADQGDLHRAQLDRILSVADLPRVTVQVMKANAPYAPLGRHGFRVYEFADQDEPPVVYMETIGQELIVHEWANVGLFIDIWQRLLSTAMSPAESVSFIRRLK